MVYIPFYKTETTETTTPTSGYVPFNKDKYNEGLSVLKVPVEDILSKSTSPYKLSGESTISQAPEKKIPFGFAGRAVNAAYQTAKSTFENATTKISSMVDTLLGVKVGTSEKIETTPLKRAVSMGEAALGVAGIGFLPVTAQIEAAKEVPILKYPAKAASFVFEKLGEAGSYVMGKSVDVLPVSDETKEIIRPFSQELGAFIAQLVGIKYGLKVAEKGIDIPKISPKAKTTIKATTQLGMGLSMTPFSTMYGIASAKITSKIQERQAKKIEITKEEVKKIIEEVKVELPKEVENLPTEKVDTSKYIPFEKAVKKEPTIEPLAQEARKYKSAEEFVKAQGYKGEPLYHGTKAEFETFDFSKARESGDVFKGIYFTDQVGLAKDYGKVKARYVALENPLRLETDSIGKNGVVNFTENPKVQVRKLFPETKGMNDSQVSDFLMKKGYDGIEYGKNYKVVFDPSKIYTKSQLTDIYNQAVKGEVKPEVPKAPEGQAVSTTGYDLLRKAVESKIIKDMPDVPTHEVQKMKDWAEGAGKIFERDPMLAKKIAMNETSSVDNIPAESVYRVVEADAIKRGDVETIIKLSNSTLPTEAGQRLKALDTGEGNSPVDILKDVKKEYEKRAKLTPENKTKANKEIKSEIDTLNAKETMSLNRFLDSIVC